VPAVIVPLFWLIKIITTGVGEASSDLLVSNLGIGLAAAPSTYPSNKSQPGMPSLWPPLS
jgi:uncharacterized membrane-anchored protein